MKLMSFYNEVHPKLRFYINHYWSVDGSQPNECSGDLLPMDHTDMIMTREQVYEYSFDDTVVHSDKIHFHGIRLEPVKLRAKTSFKSFGISFKPWGAYALIQSSMDAFVQKIVDLKSVNEQMNDALLELDFSKELPEMINALEEILLEYVYDAEKNLEHMKILEAYLIDKKSHVSERHMNRLFKKYIGVSPKVFFGIRKFENASREILYHTDNMTTVAMNNAYYDQSHFNKAFKKYTDASPKNLKNNQNILKSKLLKTKDV